MARLHHNSERAPRWWLEATVVSLLVAMSSLNAPAHAFATSVDFTPNQLERLFSSYLEADVANTVTAFPYAGCFTEAARANRLPESLLLAVARGESNFDATVVSKADAVGVMQIQWPGTAKHLGITDRAALDDPCTNIAAGSRYLRELLDRYEGNIYLALAAYNYGPGRITVGSAPTAIPDGAHWYSGYIYDHLQYVLNTTVTDYGETRQTVLIAFRRPYRAREFVKFLQAQTAGQGLRFDWFKRSRTEYEVVFHYENAAQKLRGAGLLQPLGFEVE